MSRSKAAVTHLVPSLLLLAGIAALIIFSWYPYPFWQLGKSGTFAASLILAAGLAGPLMTLAVYKKGKRGLLFDLWVIAIVQLAAISWGVFSLHQARPYWMVYTVDRFEVLSIRDIDRSWITDSRYLEKPMAGPLVVLARMPAEPATYQNLLHEIMFEGKPDLQYRPEYWSLYTERKEDDLQKSRPLALLRDTRPDAAGIIDKVVRKNGGDIAGLKFVPVLQNDGQFTAILDANSGKLIDMLMINPWVN